MQQSMGIGSSHSGQNSSGMKYQDQPGGDTFSDFVSLVCQEAQNSQNQVRMFSLQFLKLYKSFVNCMCESSFWCPLYKQLLFMILS